MAATTVGQVLRAWRNEVLGLTQEEFGALLHVSGASISRWEDDSANPSLLASEIDELVGGDGALRDLLWAADTPGGMAPGRRWTMVFGPEPGAESAWMWVRTEQTRSPGAEVGVKVEWSAVAYYLDTPLGPDGLILWAPIHMPEYPVIVELSEPGWVDFGEGSLPTGQLGTIPIVDLRRFDGPLGRTTTALLQWAELATAGRTGQWPGNGETSTQDRLRLTSVKRLRRHLERVVGTTTEDMAITGFDGYPADPDGSIAPTGHRQAYRQLRQARHLSYRQVAKLVAKRFGTTVSAGTLQRFEDDRQANPRDEYLGAVLDQALGAAGRLTHHVVATRRAGVTTQAVSFPAFWRGPVWVAFEPSGDAADDESSEAAASPAAHPVVLSWGIWRSRLSVSGPLVVSTHCTQPDQKLTITTPEAVTWTAGLGRRRDSSPIDRYWLPDTAAALGHVVRTGLKRALRLFTVSADQRRPAKNR